jgi:hypothetical protein
MVKMCPSLPEPIHLRLHRYLKRGFGLDLPSFDLQNDDAFRTRQWRQDDPQGKFHDQAGDLRNINSLTS